MPTMTVQQAYELAVKHHQAGQLREAETIYKQLIAQQPNYAHAHYMLAVLGHQVGRSTDAIPLIDKAISLRPELPDFHMFRGVLLAATQQFARAAEAFRKVTALRPDDADAYNNLGNSLRETREFDESITAYQRAIELRADFAEAFSNMSAALRDAGRADDAIAAARSALALKPNYPGALTNLGNALKDKGQFDEAMAAYRQAVTIDPNYADGHYNIGILHREKGELDAAAKAYERALALRPDFPSGKWNLSIVKLLRGDDDAWEAYEARWSNAPKPMNRGFSQPLWDGSELAGRRIVLHAEQGLGDTIHFIRYAPMVKVRGGRVIVLCQPELQRLLTGQLGIELVMVDEADLPAFDVHCPLLSLPRVFKTTVHTIPANVPYLKSEPALIERWRERLEATEIRNPNVEIRNNIEIQRGNDKNGALEPSRFEHSNLFRNSDFGFRASRPARIGLVWAGKAISPADATRSIALSRLAPLASVARVRFYSLQKGEAASQAQSPPAGMELTDWTSDLNDFADTAALISNLDLVISVDTSVAHLSGALAKPVWVLIPFAPDWRWMLGRDDSPWYPTMRLFRQPRWGNWDGAISSLAEALRERAGNVVS